MTAAELGREFRETFRFVWDLGGEQLAYALLIGAVWLLTLKYWPWRKGPKGE